MFACLLDMYLHLVSKYLFKVIIKDTRTTFMNFLKVQEQPPNVFYKKKVFLKISQNSQKNTCARVFLLIKLQAAACNFIKKETQVLAFSCEFWEIFKSAFFTEHLATASESHV